MRTLLNGQRVHACLLVLLCCGLVGCSSEAKRARYLKRAEGYFAKSEYRKAEVEYRNAARLSKEPDLHIVTRIAIIYYEQGRLLEAFPLLTNAVALKPENLDLRYKLGTVWLTFRDFTEGRAAALGILTNEPNHADAMLLLADAAVGSNDITAARQKLNEIVKAQGASWAAHAALAQLALRQLQTNEAQKQIELAAKLDSKAPPVNVMLAQLALQRQQVAEAEQFLRVAADNSPVRSPRRLLLPQLKMSQTNFAEAKALVEDVLKHAPDYVPASAMLGQIAIAQKDFEQCSRIAKSVLSWNPLSYDVRLLSARALVLQNQADKGIEEFDRLLANYDRIPELHYEAAIAHVQKGNAAEAVAKLGNAIRLNPSYADAIILRAQIQLRTGAANEAAASLAEFARTHADNARAYTVLADAYRVLGKWNEAFAVYRTLSQAMPSSPEFRFAAGSVLLQLKRPDEAKQWFEQALRLAPTYTGAADQLINISLAQNDLVTAQRVVDQQLAVTSDSPSALMTQAKVAIARKDWTTAEAALNRVLKVETNSVGAYPLLALVALEKNDVKTAVSRLETAIERAPQDISARMLLAGVYRDRLQDYGKAKSVYEAVLKISPNLATPLNDFAYLLSEKLNQLDEALPHAVKANELAPNNPAFKDTLGWIHYLRGDLPKALPLLLESAQKLTQNAEVQFHAAMASYSFGDSASARAAFNRVIQLDEALAKAKNVHQRIGVLDAEPAAPKAAEFLEAASKQDGNDFLAVWKLGQAYAHSGAAEKARVALERATKLNPAASQAFASLAFLLADKLKDYPKALEAARSARKLEPNNAAVAGLLGRLSYRTHEYAAAVALLQEYARSDKADENALYDLALACYGAGQTEQAREHLTTFINASRGSRLNDAKGIITLLDYYSGKTEAKIAEPIAKARLQSAPDDLAGLVTVGLLAQQNGKAREAADKFEQVLTLNKVLPLPQRQLAILYAEHLQDDKKALEFGARARRTFANDSELVIAMGKASFRTGDFNEAVRLLNQGIAQHPTDASAHYFLGMSYHKLLKKPEAKAALTKAMASNLDPKLAATATSTLKEL